MVVKDKMWVWGHPKGRFTGLYKTDKVSRMTPLEGALYMGARNMFMVPCGWEVNHRQYNKSLIPMQHLGWEIYKAADDPSVINQLIEEAKEFPNIDRGVFDDFYNHDGDSYKTIPLENLYRARDLLHNNPVRPLQMWMVIYTKYFGINEADDAEFQPYIEPFDGLTLWFWEERELAEFEQKYEAFKKMAAGKRKMIGLYLYNFGENKEATAEAVTWQLNRYLELMKAGEIEGVVLHTNALADLDYVAFDALRDWMQVHGDDEVPD